MNDLRGTMQNVVALRASKDANVALSNQCNGSIHKFGYLFVCHGSIIMRRQISIVDDDDSVRRALSRVFETAGYQVETYESAEPFTASETGNTMCLLLDVHLPGKSGLELQRELNDAGKRIPVVFITAFENEQTRTLALEHGAVEFLQKPLDTDQLLEVNQQTLNQSE